MSEEKTVPETQKSFLERVSEIQRELKAPKNQRNNFGKYNYRSCEDILEAVKPLTTERGIVLTVSDEVILIGARFYIKSTAKMTDAKSGETLEVTGFAREAETKKGMDDSQITGAASSYARKYALNGLFCIDDSKDADTDDFQRQQSRPANESNLVCCDCGKPFQAFKNYSAEDVYNISCMKNPDNQARCGDCMKKLNSGGN